MSSSSPVYLDHSYHTLTTSTVAVNLDFRTDSPLLTSDTMVKTRSKKSPESSLSPPALVKKTLTRKRKAAAKGPTAPKRPKTTANANATSLEDAQASSGEEPPTSTEDPEVQEPLGDEIDLQDTDDSSSAEDQDTNKKKSKTNTKTRKVGAPKNLALDLTAPKRNEDTPLAVGAHVDGAVG